MYFDAITSADHSRVYFNGTPDETKKWIQENIKDIDVSKVIVWDGKSLKRFTPREYLNR